MTPAHVVRARNLRSAAGYPDEPVPHYPIHCPGHVSQHDPMYLSYCQESLATQPSSISAAGSGSVQTPRSAQGEIAM